MGYPTTAFNTFTTLAECYATHIMLRDLLTQKSVNKLLLDTPEHVDSGNMNFKIGRPSSVYQLFSKRDFTSLNVAEIGKK
jgi:hypothetical protein